MRQRGQQQEKLEVCGKIVDCVQCYSVWCTRVIVRTSDLLPSISQVSQQVIPLNDSGHVVHMHVYLCHQAV